MADLKDFANDIKKFGDDLKKENKDLVDKIATRMQQEVSKRVESGKGQVKSHGAEATDYLPLKDNTVKSRRAKEKKGTLSPLTTPSKSNQIDTGSFHKAIMKKIKNDKESAVGVYDSVNQKKAEYNEKLGRPTFYVSKAETKIIDDIVKDHIESFIVKAGGTKKE